MVDTSQFGSAATAPVASSNIRKTTTLSTSAEAYARLLSLHHKSPTPQAKRASAFKELFDYSLPLESSDESSGIARNQLCNVSSHSHSVLISSSSKISLNTNSHAINDSSEKRRASTDENTTRAAKLRSNPYPALKQELRFLQDDIYRAKLQSKYKDAEIAKLKQNFEESGIKIRQLQINNKVLELAIAATNKQTESFENNNAELAKEIIETNQVLADVMEELRVTVESKDETSFTFQFKHGSSEDKTAGLENELTEAKENLAVVTQKLRYTKADSEDVTANIFQLKCDNGALIHKITLLEEKASQVDDQTWHINNLQERLKRAEDLVQHYAEKRGTAAEASVVNNPLEDVE